LIYSVGLILWPNGALVGIFLSEFCNKYQYFFWFIYILGTCPCNQLSFIAISNNQYFSPSDWLLKSHMIFWICNATETNNYKSSLYREIVKLTPRIYQLRFGLQLWFTPYIKLSWWIKTTLKIWKKANWCRNMQDMFSVHWFKSSH
jgi:hypothetical protein